ncbi:hypothetical protein [Rhodococcus erythropolis]|uniref:hypothetical protein n=1 Tax=Rhodococcus erythropolis TaxID=1833 RepID=UPI00087825ED|nr:hypothetical protein [Rhodococcus erythropolis]OFV78496.1 hypothetical protein RERY_10030 [Rhodococcus erythropolis]
MARTPEQVAAYDARTAAIEALHRAYHSDVEGVLTKYLVLAQRQFWDEDGGSRSTVYSSPQDDGLPLSDQLGLIEFAGARIRAMIMED